MARTLNRLERQQQTQLRIRIEAAVGHAQQLPYGSQIGLGFGMGLLDQGPPADGDRHHGCCGRDGDDHLHAAGRSTLDPTFVLLSLELLGFGLDAGGRRCGQELEGEGTQALAVARFHFDGGVQARAAVQLVGISIGLVPGAGGGRQVAERPQLLAILVDPPTQAGPLSYQRLVSDFDRRLAG